MATIINDGDDAEHQRTLEEANREMDHGGRKDLDDAAELYSEETSKDKEADEVVRRLKYRRGANLVGYKGKEKVDTGFYYCPYIPLMKNPNENTD